MKERDEDSSPGAVRVQGRCYCGEVRFEVNLGLDQAPLFTAYCHCDSCRRAHAAPLYQVVCLDAAAFSVTAGEERIRDFQKPGGRIVRAFCDQCGTRILNRFPGWSPDGRTPLALFPALLDEEVQRALPAPLRPTRHNRPEESVLDASMLADFFTHD